MAPIKSGQTFQGTQQKIEAQFAYDLELLLYRQTAEWGMRSIQDSFGRLQMPLPINDDHYCADFLECIFRLHQLRIRQVGHNQIRDVYMPQWRRTAEDDAVWINFEYMLFSEQCKNNRVSRYHVYPEYQ